VEGASLMRGSLGKWIQLLLASFGAAMLLSLLTALAYVHPVRWDLSTDSRFTLSDHALGILREVEHPIKITGFIRTGDARNIVLKDLLWQASRENQLITYTVVDVNRNPTLASKLGVDAYGSSVVESAGRRSEFTWPTEQSLISAIVHVTRPPKHVYMITGHGECAVGNTDRKLGCSLMRMALSRELYRMAELNLFDGKEVPDNADVVLVAGPKSDFTAAEIATLEQYLDHGGELLLMLDPFSAPRLAAMLAARGIEMGGDVILDLDNRLGGGEAFTSAIAQRNDRHAVTVGLDSSPLFSAFRSLRANADEDAGERTRWMLRSGTNSWGSHDPEVLHGKRAAFVAGRDVNGPLTVGLEFVRDLGEPHGESHLVVFGDSDFVTNRFLDYLGNRDLLVNTVDWLAKEERLIAPRAKEKTPGVNVFFVSAAQQKTLFRAAVLIQPGIFLGIGIVVFLWRRWSA
jgi:ABC-2 type transport system permease protein